MCKFPEKRAKIETKRVPTLLDNFAKFYNFIKEAIFVGDEAC